MAGRVRRRRRGYTQPPGSLTGADLIETDQKLRLAGGACWRFFSHKLRCCRPPGRLHYSASGFLASPHPSTCTDDPGGRWTPSPPLAITITKCTFNIGIRRPNPERVRPFDLYVLCTVSPRVVGPARADASARAGWGLCGSRVEYTRHSPHLHHALGRRRAASYPNHAFTTLTAS